MSTHASERADGARSHRRTVRLPAELNRRAEAAVEHGEFDSVSAALRDGLRTVVVGDDKYK